MIELDSMCSYYNSAFGYSKVHNLTVQEVNERIFIDLMEEEDISQGLSKIWTDIADISDNYYVNDYLDSGSLQWLILEKIDALYSVGFNSHLKMPINFDRSFMEFTDRSILSNSDAFKQKDWDQMNNFFSLPDNEMNLMAINHLYTSKDFIQLSVPELFTFLEGNGDNQNKFALSGVPDEFKSCFKQMYHDHYLKVGEILGES